MAVDLAQSSSECLDKCQLENGCRWYNYDLSDNACVMSSDCVQYTNTCETCVVGRVDCTLDGRHLVWLNGDILLMHTIGTKLFSTNNSSNLNGNLPRQYS